MDGMGLPGNLTLAVGGALAEGVVFVVVMTSIRRVVKARRLRRRPPLRMTATVGRELPAPPRKELTR